MFDATFAAFKEGYVFVRPLQIGTAQPPDLSLGVAEHLCGCPLVGPDAVGRRQAGVDRRDLQASDLVVGQRG